MLDSIERLRGEIRDDMERTCGSSTSVRSERVLSALGEIEREISENFIEFNRRGTHRFCEGCNFGGWKERAEEYKDEAAKLLCDVLHVTPCYSPWDVTESARTITERYMPLPVDADGVPIHLGDTVEGELPDNTTVNGTVTTYHIHYNDEPDTVYIKVDCGGGWTIKELKVKHCRHVKLRTPEDLLREFADAYYNSPGGELGTECVRRYVAEMRELLRTIWDDEE